LKRNPSLCSCPFNVPFFTKSESSIDIPAKQDKYFADFIASKIKLYSM
jgi:hypothetical protein